MPSVIEQDPFNEYTAGGSTTIFPYTFQLLASADLEVRLNGVVVSPGSYTLTGIGNQGGGSVNFLTAPATGVKVLLSREMSLSRDTDYQYNGDLLEATLDRDFNRVWHAIQGVQARLGSAVRAPYPNQVAELPSLLTANLGKGFGVSALGEPTFLDTDFGTTNADVTFYTAAGAGAVQTTVEEKLQHEVSVMDYIPLAERAAILAGTSGYICTAGVLAAIAYAAPPLPGNPWDLNGTRGGFVKAPRGRFIVDATIFIPAWLIFSGSGRMATIFYWGSAGAGPVFSLGRPGLAPANDPLQSFHCGLQDLTIWGNYLNVTGLEIYASFWEMRNVHVARCAYHGMKIQTSYTGRAYNCYAVECADTAGYSGVTCDGPGAGLGANDITFFGGAINNCYDGARIAQANGVVFNGVSFQSSKRYAINCIPGGGAVGVVVTGMCYFEDTAHLVNGATFGGEFQYMKVEDGYWAGQGAFHQKVFAGTAYNSVRIKDNNWDNISSPTGFIGLQNEAAGSCVFIRNDIDGNRSPDDGVPLFTPAMTVFVKNALDTFSSATLNRVDHLTQYRYQNHFNNVYTLTLTPGTSGSITLDASENSALYQRTADLVHVQGRGLVSSVSSPVGTNMRINLPFAIGSKQERSGAIGGIVIDSSSTARVFTGAEGNSYINVFLPVASVAPGQTFNFSFSYLAAPL